MSDEKIIKRYFQGQDLGENGYIANIKPLSIFQFLKQGANLKKKIPDYQRPYSWTEKELSDFLGDLKFISEQPEMKIKLINKKI